MKISKSTALLKVLLYHDIAFLIEGKNVIIDDSDYPRLTDALQRKNIKAKDIPVEPVVEELPKPIEKPEPIIKYRPPEKPLVQKPIKIKKTRERFKPEPEEPKQPFVRVKGVYSNPDYSARYSED